MDPPTSISDLPEKVLDNIFQMLNLNELKQFSSVNKIWHEYIDTRIGFKLVVGTNRHFFEDYIRLIVKNPIMLRHIVNPNLSKNHRIKLVYKIGIQSCRIGSIRSQYKVLPPFKYPGLVKSLYFDGSISSRHWNILVKPLTHLSTLTLSQYVLLDVDVKQMWLDLPNILSFTLSGKPPMTNPYNLSARTLEYVKNRWTRMILNTVYLFRRLNAPRIKQIVLQKIGVQSGKQEDIIIEYLLKFIVRHKDTLKHLSIAVQQQCDLAPINSRLETSFQELIDGLAGLQLESFHIQNTRSQASRTQQLLFAILQQQTHNQLKDILWKFHPDEILHHFIPELVDKNAHIASIEMSLPQGQESINCQVFAKCTCLTILTLIIGKPKLDLPDTQLIATNLLPSTLTKLRICGLKVDTEDARFIATELPHLALVELKDVGDSGLFGLTANSLNDVLTNKRILQVSLINSINKESCAADGTDGFTQFLQNTVQKHGVVDMENKRLQQSWLMLTFSPVRNQYVACSWWPMQEYQDNYFEFNLPTVPFNSCSRRFNNLELQFPMNEYENVMIRYEFHEIQVPVGELPGIPLDHIVEQFIEDMQFFEEDEDLSSSDEED